MSFRRADGRSLRVLLAHDARAATCDALALAIEDALGDVEIVDISSVEGARQAIATETFDACLICLDLPPAPAGGARLGAELVSHGYPVVLVTRSLRWLPPDATELQQVPWIPPEASAAEVAKAIAAVSAECDSFIRPRAGIDELLEEAPDERKAARLLR
jgi:hypothetical protein